MPKNGILHLHNCLPQRQVVTYRLTTIEERRDPTKAERRNFQQTVLEPWRPNTISCPPELVEDLIAHFRRGGAILDLEARERLPNHIIPFVINIDKPVTIPAREAVVQHNRGVREVDGQQRRQAAAVAANDAVTQALTNQAGQPPEAAPVQFEMEIEQDSENEVTGKRLTEGYRLDPNAPKRTHQAAPSRQPRRRAG